MPRDARAVAARVIADVLGGRSLSQVLPRLSAEVAPRDKALLQHLCYGTARQGPKLIALLDALLDKPLRQRDRDIQGLLLCGLYQLDYMRTPDHAAVDATVNAARALKKSWAGGVANAVLRRYLRDRDQLQAALAPAAAHAHPEWLYRLLHEQWPDHAADIIAANNEQPPMTRRVNSRVVSATDYLARLGAAGMEARPGTLSPVALTLGEPVDVAELPGFDQGMASVQDEAAQLAAALLEAGPGDRVLDACAAPGGKTCHVLECEQGLQEMVAMDIDAERLQKVDDNLQRLGLDARLSAGDGASPPPELEPGTFDRILVDAPCSATGVIRRNPDVKLLRRSDDLPGLASQQLGILRGLWPLLRPGGRLLYATCSVLAQENDQVILAFTGSETSATVATPATEWGEPTATGRQLLPSPDGPDGLFYALLDKG